MPVPDDVFTHWQTFWVGRQGKDGVHDPPVILSVTIVGLWSQCITDGVRFRLGGGEGVRRCVEWWEILHTERYVMTT